MTPLIFSFDAYQGQTAREIGGKGLNLCRLRQAGFQVPPGHCVGVSAYDAMLAANPALAAVIDDWFAMQTGRDQVDAAWRAAVWPQALSDALDQIAAGAGAGRPLAVRSSAIVEDSAQFSFAGQFATRLGVAGADALRDALKVCWASLCSETLREHATAHGLGRADLKMAVVVQAMIDPRAAGVLFTVDPMDNDRERMRIEASYGLGEALVSGEITPDAVVVDKRSGVAVSSDVAHKAVQLRYRDGRVVELPVDASLQDAPCLSAKDVEALSQVALRVESWAGKPQDIEWAFDADTLHLVQTRDITTLLDTDSALFTPREIAGEWTRENMAERFYKVNTPFTISTLYPALEKGLEATFDRIGIVPDRSFGPLIRVFYGRPYLNKSLVAHAMRGIKVDNTQMEAVLGDRGNTGFNPRLPLIAVGVLRMIAGSYRQWQEFQRECLDPIQVVPEGALAEKSLPELRAELDAQLRVFDRYWVVHMINVRCADFTQKIIRMLLGRVHADKQEAFETFCRLSSGFVDNITFESDAELHRISRLVLQRPHLAEMLRSGAIAAFEQALAADPEGRAIAERFDRFIARFGSKLVHQEFHEPQWCDDRRLVWRHIAAAMDGENEDPMERAQKKSAERERTYTQTLNRFKGPLGWALRPAFSFVYRRMCDYMPARENDQFHFGKLVRAMRGTLLHMGRRLVQAGAIAHEDDIHFLELQKIPLSVEDVPDLKAYVARQRALFARYEAMEIPYDINGAGKSAEAAGAQWKGYGVSGGIATATARVALEPSELDSVDSGMILVTYSTNPAWTPAFARISALVTESGGMLSHGAIMAREYGIPAVLGVRGATALVASGDRIVVDGTEGVVRPAPAPAPSANAAAGKAATVPELESA